MSEFKRRRGESASAWCARLGEVNMAALSPQELDDLTLRRVLAGRALQREARSRRRNPAAEANGSRESDAYRRCQEAVQALSAEERQRLMRWLEASFTE